MDGCQKSKNAIARPILSLMCSIKIFVVLICLTMFILFVVDDSTYTNFTQIWNSSKTLISTNLNKNIHKTTINNVPSLSPEIVQSHGNANMNNVPNIVSLPLSSQVTLDWVSVELESNYTSNLIRRWLEPGGEPCKDSQTNEIKFLNIDDKNPITLSTSVVHEIIFQTIDEQGNPRCQGGDFFEIDIQGESWKSRPPLKDYGNGTYSFILQIEPHFAGKYALRIILLFRHYKGLSFSPTRFAIDKQLKTIPITFTWIDTKLPDLKICQKSDFTRGVWAGRWTRHAQNDSCEVDYYGRYRCLNSNYPCTNPWCNGSLGVLESNGWVYSTHCSFKLFSVDEAWNCLNQRWIFLWGDSNHVDTIRNIMFFILNLPKSQISRRFDLNVTNPRDGSGSQWIRITNIFNGHWDEKSNYLGLDSLSNEGYRKLLKGYFSGSIVPDTVIFNSGLHDGVYWPNIRRFIGGAEKAAVFWKEVVDGVKQRGLNVPNFIFRSTITAGGYARTLAFNPSKIEAFNGILLEKMNQTGIVTGIIDNFDMTWAWHYDNRCNDGVHYGRFPAKRKWRDGQIGHQYFVDLMLGHVLLTAICGR